MRYNSSQKSGLKINSNRQQNNYMELANTCKIVNYFINNTICCFDCREFCRAEHKIYDWLTRQHHPTPPLTLTKRNKQHRELLNYTHFSHYHRHKRRPRHPHFSSELLSKPLTSWPHTPVTTNSIFVRRGLQSDCHNKFYYINSRKAKFKDPPG